MSWLPAPRSRRLLLGPGLLVATLLLAVPQVFAGTLSDDTGGLTISASGFRASDEVRDRLRSGKVIVETESVRGSSFPRFRGIAVVEAPPEQVWAVVEDCGHYDSHLPRIVSSQRLSRSGKKVRCESVLDFPAPFKDARVVSDGVHERLGSHRFRRTWKLVEGDFDVNEGKWLIVPFDEQARQSLVIYETHAEPHAQISPTVLRLAQRRAMPNLFRKLRTAAGA